MAENEMNKQHPTVTTAEGEELREIMKTVYGALLEKGYKLEVKEDFNPYRESMHAFRDADIKSKNELIKKEPSYGKIICRCEGVTEGEILKAIRTNPKPADLDGVKRRTRAQMGRCQGGFCMPYITELLAKELGVNCQDITKSGKGSQIIVGKTKEALK